MKFARLIAEYCVVLPIGIALLAYELGKDKWEQIAQGSR